MAYGPHSRKCVLMTVVALLSLAQVAPAQTASDDAVKAAYVYNFAKFIEWPSATFADVTTSMRFCILNDHPFGNELSRIVAGKLIAGRPIEVVHVHDGEQCRNC